MLRASTTIAAALPPWVRSGSQIHRPLPSGSGEPSAPLAAPARNVTGGAGLGAGGAGRGATARVVAGGVAGRARAGACGRVSTFHRAGHLPDPATGAGVFA